MPSAPPEAHLLALGLVGESCAMVSLRAEVSRYAPCSASVLVLGETGTGKELVARALHDLSPRSEGPFVAVNVATLRRELATSELFGHARGAFTGALSPHRGHFEQAHQGTLFLDEVGELALDAQADLLRVLETGEVRPVGSERVRRVDVRLVTATHRDLARLVTEGRFREDLYYRLHVLPVRVPPLRARRADLPALVEHLLARLVPEAGVRVVTSTAMTPLARQEWPGNVRQLLNVLRRACARSDDRELGPEVILDALSFEPATRVEHPPERLRPYDVQEALTATGGSIAGAARKLGVPRSTLRDRIRTYQRLTSSSEPLP